VTDSLQDAARRIAERGRDAVVLRLRPVFARTAAARAGGAPLSADQLERLVQSAADRADGAVWRRALAQVGMDELGLSLTEAVNHPAVRQAQEMLGVPAYEVGPPGSESETPGSESETPGTGTETPVAEPPPVPSAIRVPAVHLSGIETLPAGAQRLELRFADSGLDVIDARDGEPIGRLTWPEIASLELPRRRSIRRRRSVGAELVVRTERGQARFELPELDEEQARQHLAPVLERARGLAGR
jgi:hypothetical protein